MPASSRSPCARSTGTCSSGHEGASHRRSPRRSASGRGVTALPRWLAQDYARQLPLATARLGARGIAKQIHLGARTDDLQGDQAAASLRGFIELARSMFQSADEPGGANEPACPPAS